MTPPPAAPPASRVRWQPTFRIIPSRFPPVDLFERVADPADLDDVFAIESRTNDRLRQEVGDLALVPPEDRVAGAGASYLMAPFTHVSTPGGRFHDGSFGAYYTARARETAIAETVHHRERFLRATSEAPLEIEMRVLRATLDADLHDLRGRREEWRAVYDPEGYAASQHLARRLRAAASWGLVYDSVRHPGGECAAVLRPPALSRCRQAEHLGYRWDGERIALVYEKRILRR
jgi:RES domain-containing protein